MQSEPKSLDDWERSSDWEPEYRTTNERLSKVLQILDLTEKFPGRLSREDLYQITKCSLLDELPKCHEELANYFVHKIARNDYRAREFRILRSENKTLSTIRASPKFSYRANMNKRAEEKRELDVSPLDIIIAVFLCCDDICRQDLISHMWHCRLAIPLVIQEKAPPILPSCYLWPLRNLIMKWETQYDGHIRVREGRLVKESFTSVAFIRVGKIRLSKSALINNVISVSEKTHSIFFHRDSRGSTKHRYLTDGLVDISWYFPTPKSEGQAEDHFHDAVMFLNLHGDACQLESYLLALSKLANIITVLCKVKYLTGCKHVIQPFIDMGKKVLLIFTDKEIGEAKDNIIETFANNIKATENQLEYLEAVDKTRAALVQETRSLLMKLDGGQYVCLDEVCSSDINFTVDEKTDQFLTTKKMAENIFTLINKTPYKERKSNFFYLQGEPWINWAKADKEIYRITYKGKDEDIEKYMSTRMKTMKDCRSKQQECLKERNTHILAEMFLNSVSISDSTKRKLFIRWLKFEIDDLSREDLGPVYTEYHRIMKQLKDAEKEEKELLQGKLANLDKEISLRSFGIEHIIREIGQIYEALQLQEPHHPLLKHNLPELAANILMDGYPFELFDGHVNAVPIQWVTNVLDKLDNILKKKHNTVVNIKVISALGIQSSGKSTMLNALFGCQYAVSAGRCTRGLYCQLIKVEETYSKPLGIDYILAIDTEGLRAPELSASGQMVKHDNELSTFVIGLGDLTILNLMGENTTYLDDILPISVHAFLRMEMTTNLKPKCIIVHQNVNKEDQQKLLQHERILADYLDKTTEIVCKFEDTETKTFKDIIEFDVSKDVYYLPTLLEGSHPMAPISTRYSDELNILKQRLVKKDTDQKSNTLASFITHLQNLWSAIKRDDFVYQFRNTIETEARSKLDKYWCEANWKFRQPIRDILRKGYTEIENTQNVNELDTLIIDLENKVTEEVTKEHLRQKDAFSTFVSEANALMTETMMKWSVDMDKRFDDLRTELIEDTRKKLKEFQEWMRGKFSLKNHKLKYKDTLKENIVQIVKQEKLKKCGNITQEEISNLFMRNWGGLKTKILNESTVSHKPINIANDAFHALSRAFPLGKLQKLVVVKPLESYDLHDFKSQDLVSRLQTFKSWFFYTNEQLIDAEDFVQSLFFKVKDKLKSREHFPRPYSKEDIEEVVENIMDHFLKNKKPALLKSKDEIHLAVIASGHAIKGLKKLHEEYEEENDLGNLLEKDKNYYHRIFSALCNDAETVNILGIEFQEIVKKGILEKMTHTLHDKIEIDLRRDPFMLTTKSMVIYGHMINMASDGSYEDFTLFIRNPSQSIDRYICTRIDQYSRQEQKPLEQNFDFTCKKIEAEVEQALQKSTASERSDFETWFQTFRRETKDLIVLENIDRLHELGKEKEFDLELFYKTVLQCLKSGMQEIKQEMRTYLSQNYKSIKHKVMKRILKNTIGCTEGCPFCGAICIVAHVGHVEEHYTTLHRPMGFKRNNYINTKILSTNTCPQAISKGESFEHHENGASKWYSFKDYKSVYPKWKITADETGDETSFWNWVYATYVDNIAGTDLKAPEIPASWKELDRETEIKKLEDKMKQ